MKKIGHWIAFIFFGYFATVIVLALAVCILLFCGPWLMDNFSTFGFIFIGSCLLSLYYYLIFSMFLLYYNFLDRKKPDYWVSNIFIVSTALYFYYVTFKNIYPVFVLDINKFKSFKGIVYIISILPALFKIFFFTLIYPFIKTKDY